MLIVDVRSPDSVETRFGLSAVVVFEELLTGAVTSQQVSARSALTDSTSLGTKNSIPVPDDIPSRFLQTLPANAPTVPNAGPWSSNPVTK
jgi:hypothetical protein